jgi:hypothetical protein
VTLRLVSSTARPASRPVFDSSDPIHELLALDVLLSAAEEAADRAHQRLERTTTVSAARLAHAAFEEAERERVALVARRHRLIAEAFGVPHLKLASDEAAHG